MQTDEALRTDRYVSTRGDVGPEGRAVAFDRVLLDGLAPDGGLYVPQAWPDLSALAARAGELSYADLSAGVLALFVGDALSSDVVRQATADAAASFSAPDTTPLVEIEPGLWLLELFHGPTLAFKDCAMQLLAPLTRAALAQTGDRLLALTATSGDTGAAAVNAFANVDGVDLVVFHPAGRVSPAQRRQMTTCLAPNVLNISVRGDFDDCQRLVKALSVDPRLRERRRVSTVNSINWCRLAGQVPYYLRAAARVGGRARFVVPTGNLGDAFAGWAAMRGGAGVESLLAVVNANDALARALESGVYERRAAQATSSVAMDVQAPSNFERLFFESCGRDAAATRAFFESFADTGRAVMPDDVRAAATRDLAVTSTSQADTAEEIGRTYKATGRHICPHTAVALHAARRLPRDGAPIVVMATAHPAKFPEAVGAAAGAPVDIPEALARFDAMPERLEEFDADLESLVARVLKQLG